MNGSEKQIKWAIDLKRELFIRIDQVLNQELNDDCSSDEWKELMIKNSELLKNEFEKWDAAEIINNKDFAIHLFAKFKSICDYYKIQPEIKQVDGKKCFIRNAVFFSQFKKPIDELCNLLDNSSSKEEEIKIEKIIGKIDEFKREADFRFFSWWFKLSDQIK